MAATRSAVLLTISAVILFAIHLYSEQTKQNSKVAIALDVMLAEVPVIVLGSLCQRNGSRLKTAGRQHVLKDQHRTVPAPRTPVRRTFGGAPDDKLAPLPEDSHDT